MGTPPTFAPRLLCFEAVRGLAAFSVLLGHFLMGLWAADIFQGHWEAPAAVRFLAHRLFWNGHLAVTIFFVLSGFVLSLGYFQGGSAAAPGSAAVRRYPRLMLPAAASILLTFALLQLGAVQNRAAVGHMNAAYGLPPVGCSELSRHPHEWLANYCPSVPHLPTALREAVWGAFVRAPSYNLVLWTMSVELAGSFLVYGFLAACGGLRNRWLLYLVAGAVLLACERPFLLAFLLGTALCDLWAWNRRTWQWSLPLGPALAAVGVAVFVLRFRGNLSAVLIVGATAASPGLQRLLEGRWLAFLGRVSFALYLLHMPVFCSLGCGLYLALCRGLGWPHGAGAAATLLASVAASLLGAWAFYHGVDRPAMALARKLDLWLFRPRPLGEPLSRPEVRGARAA